MKRKITSDGIVHQKIDTLVIVGNGFDVWQGLPTTYANFYDYYRANREVILKKLHLPLYEVAFNDGEVDYVSDVELIYGNPFSPSDLDETFWGDFEYSLSQIDDQRLNLFFGKNRKGLRSLKKSVKNAKKILTTAFCEWAKSITVTKSAPTKAFGENCLFVNFNYTDTLTKRFGVNPSRIFHPHGSILDGDDIIFGHSSHPETPDKTFYELGGRFRGLYFVESLLHLTDKQVLDHVNELTIFLALHSVLPEDIKEVYVLGHAINPVDVLYFDFFADATTLNRPTTVQPCDEEYAIDVRRKCEQEAKNQAVENFFYKLLGMKKKSTPPPEKTRNFDALWHVTCYSQSDKEWIPTAIRELGITNVKYYDDIPSCIKEVCK